jgi:ribosome-associated protein
METAMVEKISRSEQKRLFKQVEALAAELAELSDNDLKKFPGNEEVKAEIIECRGLKAGARKRQIKYLAKVLRQYSLDEIYSYLKDRKGSSLQENQVFHQSERWRDVIINDAMEVFDQCRRERAEFEPDFHSENISSLTLECPDIDEKDLRRCTYQYVRTRNKTYYRELFRIVKAAIEGQSRNKLDNSS